MISSTQSSFRLSIAKMACREFGDCSDGSCYTVFGFPMDCVPRKLSRSTVHRRKSLLSESLEAFSPDSLLHDSFSQTDSQADTSEDACDCWEDSSCETSQTSAIDIKLTRHVKEKLHRAAVERQKLAMELEDLARARAYLCEQHVPGY